MRAFVWNVVVHYPFHVAEMTRGRTGNSRNECHWGKWSSLEWSSRLTGILGRGIPLWYRLANISAKYSGRGEPGGSGGSVLNMWSIATSTVDPTPKKVKRKQYTMYLRKDLIPLSRKLLVRAEKVSVSREKMYCMGVCFKPFELPWERTWSLSSDTN